MSVFFSVVLCNSRTAYSINPQIAISNVYYSTDGKNEYEAEHDLFSDKRVRNFFLLFISRKYSFMKSFVTMYTGCQFVKSPPLISPFQLTRTIEQTGQFYFQGRHFK